MLFFVLRKVYISLKIWKEIFLRCATIGNGHQSNCWFGKKFLHLLIFFVSKLADIKIKGTVFRIFFKALFHVEGSR